MHQGHSVFLASFPHLVTTAGAAGLGDEGNAMLAGMVDIVTKRNEAIAYERDTSGSTYTRRASVSA